MNHMVQQFQNLKSNQEENKDDHDLPTMESEKKINERMNKMEEMIRRACKMEDLIDYDSLSHFPNVRLPPKFKMPTLDKFDRTGCPKSHLKIYMRAMQPLGAIEEVLAQMFQNTLTGAPLRWFFNLDDARARSWEDICREFISNTSTIWKWISQGETLRLPSKSQKNPSLLSLPSGEPRPHR